MHNAIKIQLNQWVTFESYGIHSKHDYQLYRSNQLALTNHLKQVETQINTFIKMACGLDDEPVRLLLVYLYETK